MLNSDLPSGTVSSLARRGGGDCLSLSLDLSILWPPSPAVRIFVPGLIFTSDWMISNRPTLMAFRYHLPPAAAGLSIFFFYLLLLQFWETEATQESLGKINVYSVSKNSQSLCFPEPEGKLLLSNHQLKHQGYWTHIKSNKFSLLRNWSLQMFFWFKCINYLSISLILWRQTVQTHTAFWLQRRWMLAEILWERCTGHQLCVMQPISSLIYYIKKHPGW